MSNTPDTSAHWYKHRETGIIAFILDTVAAVFGDHLEAVDVADQSADNVVAPPEDISVDELDAAADATLPTTDQSVSTDTNSSEGGTTQ